MPDPHILRAYCAANPGTKFARRTWTKDGRAFAEVRLILPDGRKIEIATNGLRSEQELLDFCSRTAIEQAGPVKHDVISGFSAKAGDGVRDL